MNFSVVTPTGSIVECEIVEVTIPGALGEFAVMPEHRPAVMMVGGGELTYVTAKGSERIFVKGGIAEIGPTHVTLLTDVAVTPEGLAAGFDGKARRFDDVEYLTDDILLKQLTEDNFANAVGSP